MLHCPTLFGPFMQLAFLILASGLRVVDAVDVFIEVVVSDSSEFSWFFIISDS